MFMRFKASHHLRPLRATAALLVLCGCEVIHGSGDVVTEERDVDEFEQLMLEGEGEVHFAQSDRAGLVVEAEDNLVEELITEVRGDTLVIKTRDRVILDPTKPIIFHVESPNLRSITVKGSAEFQTDELEMSDFEIEISGSGALEIGKLQADSVLATISGSGDVRLSGKVQTQSIDISGSGEYRCGNLESEDARVDVSGSGEVEVFATETLEVDISGSGDVGVRGKPETDVDISGSGDISSIN